MLNVSSMGRRTCLSHCADQSFRISPLASRLIVLLDSWLFFADWWPFFHWFGLPVDKLSEASTATYVSLFVVDCKTKQLPPSCLAGANQPGRTTPGRTAFFSGKSIVPGMPWHTTWFAFAVYDWTDSESINKISKGSSNESNWTIHIKPLTHASRIEPKKGNWLVKINLDYSQYILPTFSLFPKMLALLPGRIVLRRLRDVPSISHRSSIAYFLGRLRVCYDLSHELSSCRYKIQFFPRTFVSLTRKWELLMVYKW